MIKSKMKDLHDEEDFLSHDHIHLQSIHAYISTHVLQYVCVVSFPPPSTYLTVLQTNTLSAHNSSVSSEDMVSAEILAILYLASGRKHSVHLACDLLGFIGRADTSGMTSIQTYISDEDARKRIEVYAELSTASDQALGTQTKLPNEIPLKLTCGRSTRSSKAHSNLYS